MSESISQAQALRRAGKTVDEIASKLEVHPRTVNKWFEKYPVIINQDEQFEGDVPSNMDELVSSFEAVIFEQAGRLEHHSKSNTMLSHHQLGQLVKVSLMVKELRLLVGGGEDDGDINEADEKEAAHLREILFKILEAKFITEDEPEATQSTPSKVVKKKIIGAPTQEDNERWKEEGRQMRLDAKKAREEEEAAAAPLPRL